jgi:hypothetical protein
VSSDQASSRGRREENEKELREFLDSPKYFDTRRRRDEAEGVGVGVRG